MAETVTFSVRMPKAEKERLDALARSLGRSGDEVASEAITAYVDANAWQVEQIRKAVEQADAGGPFYAHEDVMAWLESWGTDHELPPPRTKIKPWPGMRVIRRAHARDDLIAIRRYVGQDNPAAAQLAERPQTGRPGRWTGTRELVVTGAPYLLPNRVRDGRVVILRVLHGAQARPAAQES